MHSTLFLALGGEYVQVMCHALTRRSYVYSPSSGRHSANASIWIAVVTMLATLDFNPATDVDGNDITFEAEYMNGLAR